jgi:diguanylate cyclase (GGDEF)-like protein
MSSVRASDSVGRWGGDEFVILAPEADAETAAGLCKRVREFCPLAAEIGSGAMLAVELSIGAATLQANESLEQLLSRADAAMYADKSEHKTAARSAPAHLGAS